MTSRVSEESQRNGDGGEYCADGSQADLANSQGEGCGTVAKKVPELAEELVERIIARMPFPALFKAGSLSKAWHSRFADSSSRNRPSSLFFQEQVASVSPRWPVYCPIYASRREGIVGFDKGVGQWRSVLTSSNWPPDWRFLNVSGPLLFVFASDGMVFETEIYVTNIMTRKWRKLPKPALLSQHGEWLRPNGSIKILPLEADGFRVLLVHKSGAEVHVQIYDSRLDAWTAKEPQMVNFGSLSGQGVFVDEILYTLCESVEMDVLQVWAYNALQNLWTAMILPSFPMEIQNHGSVLRCGKRIMVALASSEATGGSAVIYELLHTPLRLEYVATSNTRFWTINLDYYGMLFSSDADFLYFGHTNPRRRVLTFNVHTKEWGTLPRAPCASEDSESMFCEHACFEPGLNPFMTA